MGTEPVIWERDDHTKAKHELLLAFFNKWVSIHSEHFAKRGGGLVRIYDGFAGPGVYSGGESGSPLILMRALCTNRNLRQRWQKVRYELRFVEKDAARAELLDRKLNEFETAMRSGPGWTDRVQRSVICGRYEENVPQPVPGNSALFLFLDPFGYSHAPMTLTQGLVQRPKSDTLIFLPLSFVNRFAGREGQERALDRFFGTPEWRDVPDGQGRPDACLSYFRHNCAPRAWIGYFPFACGQRSGATHTGSLAPRVTLRGSRASRRASGRWTQSTVRALPRLGGARGSGGSRSRSDRSTGTEHGTVA